VKLAQWATSLAYRLAPEAERKAIDYAHTVFAALGDTVGLTLTALALAHKGDTAGIDALVTDIRAAIAKANAGALEATLQRKAAPAATVEAPAPPADVLIVNPHHAGCGSPFCDICGAVTGVPS
jgi:hypothetical protein